MGTIIFTNKRKLRHVCLFWIRPISAVQVTCLWCRAARCSRGTSDWNLPFLLNRSLRASLNAQRSAGKSKCWRTTPQWFLNQGILSWLFVLPFSRIIRKCVFASLFGSTTHLLQYENCCTQRCSNSTWISVFRRPICLLRLACILIQILAYSSGAQRFHSWRGHRHYCSKKKSCKTVVSQITIISNR